MALSKRRTSGFTLVELLVVIAIIAMLAGIIIPAAGSVVEAARRTKCAGKLTEVAKALNGAAGRKGYFPGIVNRMQMSDGSVNYVSWVVPVLNDLDKGELYKDIQNRRGGTAVYLDFLVCDSNPPEEKTNVLSIVANAGRKDVQGSNTMPPDWAENGIFMDGSRGDKKRLVGLEDIPDGVGQTLLLSENLQATTWGTSSQSIADVREEQTGFVWWPESDPKPESKRINKDRTGGGSKSDYNHARPSSNHPGGVNVTYCNAATKWMSEDIDYVVYCKLMTPNDHKAKDPGSTSDPSWDSGFKQKFYAPLDGADIR